MLRLLGDNALPPSNSNSFIYYSGSTINVMKHAKTILPYSIVSIVIFAILFIPFAFI